jgi:hypothetical protein
MTNNFTRNVIENVRKIRIFYIIFDFHWKQWQYFSEHENSDGNLSWNAMSIKSIKFSIVSPRNSILKIRLYLCFIRFGIDDIWCEKVS